MWGLDQRAVRFGTAATAVATVTVLILTALVPFDAFRAAVFGATGIMPTGGFWFFVRFLGGPLGGIVTGYLTDETWEESSTNGVRASILGLLIVYGLYAGVVISSSLVRGTFPPLFFVFVVVPLLNGLVFFGVYLLGGVFGGVIGMWLRRLREGTLLT